MNTTIQGYMIQVEVSEEALTVTGANKAARIALRGQHHDDGPLVIRRDQIAGAELRDANAMVNGRLTIRTADGTTAKLNFRKKQAPGFRELAAQIGADR